MNRILNKPRIKLFLVLLAITVVIAAIAGFAVNMIFGKSQEEKQINSFMPNELTLGTSFTLDEVVEYMNYEPLWIKSDGIDVQLFAEKTSNNELVLEETDELITYSASDRTFTINGVGSGEIRIFSNIDKTVYIKLPYETKFQSANTESILRENFPAFFNDNIVTSSEFNSIKEIKLPTANEVNLIDFASCSGLERVILSTSKDIAPIQGLATLASNVQFLVYGDFYYEYLKDDAWATYYERIFPIVNLEENKTTLVFEFNGGSMIKAGKGETHYFESVITGNTLNLSEYSISKNGYTFLGWYLSSDKGNTFTTKITGDYIFDSNTKLYANWVVNEYDVCYNDNFVTELPDMQHATFEQQFNISEFIPVRTGYTFLGWATEENSNVVTYLPGASVQKLSNIDKDVVNLYGVWAANNYSIKYHANGGSNAPAIQENLAYGEDVQLSTKEPGRTGYAFLGWSTNQNATDYEFKAGATVKNLVSDAEGVVTLYAVWAANNYSIIYDANNGSNAPVAQENLNYGETITLTTDEPQRVGYVFLGWALNASAVEPSYLPGASVKNLVSTSGGEVTLYAVWELATFYLKYDANGGEGSPNDDVLTYKTPGSVATVTPTRTGYTFSGWSVVKDGELTYSPGALLDEAAVNSLYSNGATLYAVWSVNYIKVSISTSNASVSGEVSGKYYPDGSVALVNGGEYAYGSTITVYVSYSESENRKCTVDGVSISSGYTFTMPASNVSISASSEASCVAAGTLVTLADGSQKKVEDLLSTDLLLVFDHTSGTYESAPILFIENDGWKDYVVINLVFSNGQTTKVIDEHAFFDLTLNKYVYIDATNYAEFIGHKFAVYSSANTEITNVVLENAYVQVEYTGCYSLITAYHMNYFVDGLFSMPGGISGLFNIFEYDETMAYDSEKMQSDIEKYGLYTYEDFEEYVPYEVFEYMFPAKYFKVAVGKGMITYEEILRLIDYYLVKHGFI